MMTLSEQHADILIIKPSSLGDIIHGLQVAQQIHHVFHLLNIDWVVRDCFCPIIRMVPWIRNVHIFHRHGGLLKFIQLIRKIRHHRYDYILDMQGLARSGIITYFAHGGKKIGRYDSRELSGLTYDKTINTPPPTSQHAIDILCQFLPLFGLPPKLTTPLTLQPSPSKNISSFVDNRDNSRRLIILFPESRRKEKEWAEFQALASALSEHCSSADIIIAGQRNHIISPQYSNCYNFSGETTLDDIVYLIQHATMVVTNDSAPLHIASALAKTTVALFGPTEACKFGPYGSARPQHCVLSSKNKNINELSFDFVMRACLQKYQECMSGCNNQSSD